MYTDRFLKFNDEAQATSVLYTEVPTEFDEEGNPTAFDQRPNYINIDVLGVLYNDDAVLDDEGNVVTPATPIEGWHVNVRVMPNEDPAPLEPFSITPTLPRRIWG